MLSFISVVFFGDVNVLFSIQGFIKIILNYKEFNPLLFFLLPVFSSITDKLWALFESQIPKLSSCLSLVTFSKFSLAIFGTEGEWLSPSS